MTTFLKIISRLLLTAGILLLVLSLLCTIGIHITLNVIEEEEHIRLSVEDARTLMQTSEDLPGFMDDRVIALISDEIRMSEDMVRLFRLALNLQMPLLYWGLGATGGYIVLRILRSCLRKKEPAPASMPVAAPTAPGAWCPICGEPRGGYGQFCAKCGHRF